MRIKQIQELLAIYRYRSISKAAEQLYISQPSLSASLTAIEEELGITIFDRTNKGTVITPQGELIIQEAWNIVDSMDRIYHLAETNQQFNIKIAIGPNMEFLIPNTVKAFHQKWADVSLDFFYPDNFANSLDDMLKGHYKIAIGSYPIQAIRDILPDKKFSYQDLFTDAKQYVFLNKSHPLSSAKVINIEEIQEMIFVLPHISTSEVYCQIYPEIKALCKVSTPNLQSAFDIITNNPNYATISNLSKSFIPFVQKHNPDLMCIPLESRIFSPEEKRDFLIIYPHSSIITKPEQDLVKIIINLCTTSYN